MDLQQARELSTVESWVEFFKTAEIPVLKQTAREIGDLRADEDNASTRDITAVVLNDPMMVFKVLSYAQQHKSKVQSKDLVQVEQALLMMGTTTFFNKIVPIPTVESVLGNNLSALMDLLKLIIRAHRASHFATEFAVHLMDLHSEEVRLAALLHDLAEMLLWCFDTEKMNIILQKQEADKTLRSKAVQQEVLGFVVMDLQQEIVKAFQLPKLLADLMNDEASGSQRVRNVLIAVNLARHSANGWDDAALPDDYRDLAKLIRTDVQRAMHIVGAPSMPT